MNNPANRSRGDSAPQQRTFYTVRCTVCRRHLSKSFSGTDSFVSCPKCKSELHYTVSDAGPSIEITKGPKHPTAGTAVPS